MAMTRFATRVAPDGDGMRQTMEQLDRLLCADSGENGTAAHPVLKFPGGEEMELPEMIVRLLRDLAPMLSHGRSVIVMPEDATLTTQEAADLLGISRPFLKRLLDRGKIPYHAVGSHRRVKVADVLAYRQQREQERQKQVEEIIELSEELGAYA